MQAEPFDTAARAYVAAHFWTPAALAEAAGVEPGRVTELAAAGIIPGPIYRRDPQRGWWSALAGWVDGGDGTPDAGAEAWVSPWAVWSLRAAQLAGREGVSDAVIARRAQESFGRDFTAALATILPARIAFPDCFDAEGRVDPAMASVAADTQWRGWLRGGYAVCLRAFTGETCVQKESLGALLKRHVSAPDDWPMSAAETLEACAALAALMLPFAPWERPVGTPGRTIDTLLARHALGRERPYD
ncbi:DUF6058 family natural product biosynthesis protein [uncultured Brevundimonas sp.]|uniref:DUF6058 family natural product biosynthesis protein n=1 Tax=uncultured Brevundimonas sp. TaxID=213418 RepID=UPI0030ED61BB|tara:strand:+ start:1291 stop:2025 length:735 start_codon:yes stop_codon:yes gene_type:complete